MVGILRYGLRCGKVCLGGQNSSCVILFTQKNCYVVSTMLWELLVIKLQNIVLFISVPVLLINFFFFELLSG